MALTTQFAAGGKLLASELNSLIKGMRGHIGGLGISNGTDVYHDIDIAVGSAVDSTGAHLLILTSALTKQIDAIWAAGDDTGGLFTGAVASSTWYHFFLIGKTDGTIDAGFDTSVTAANIPSGYTAYRRLGSLLTDGSANIIAFVQMGDEIYWLAPVSDYSAANPGTLAITLTLTVPTGVEVMANISGYLYDNSPVANSHLLFTAPDQTDTAPDGSYRDLTVGPGGEFNNNRFYIKTNTSRQIRFRLGNSDAGVNVRIMTHGWVDYRS